MTYANPREDRVPSRHTTRNAKTSDRIRNGNPKHRHIAGHNGFIQKQGESAPLSVATGRRVTTHPCRFGSTRRVRDTEDRLAPRFRLFPDGPERIFGGGIPPIADRRRRHRFEERSNCHPKDRLPTVPGPPFTGGTDAAGTRLPGTVAMQVRCGSPPSNRTSLREPDRLASDGTALRRRRKKRTKKYRTGMRSPASARKRSRRTEARLTSH